MPVTRRYFRESDARRVDVASREIVEAVWSALDGESDISDLDIGAIAHEVAQCFKARCRDHLEVEVVEPDGPIADVDIHAAGHAAG